MYNMEYSYQTLMLTLLSNDRKFCKNLARFLHVKKLADIIKLLCCGFGQYINWTINDRQTLAVGKIKVTKTDEKI